MTQIKFKSSLSLIVVIYYCCLQFALNVNGEDAQPNYETKKIKEEVANSDNVTVKRYIPKTIDEIIKLHEMPKMKVEAKVDDCNEELNSLEPRVSNDRNFIKDIVDRLHALDADIGKLLFNSTSMYAPNDQTIAFQENNPKGGEKFTEVLTDLDSLQDEIGGLINNATRTRQYNILVRLRPLNTIIYRIRNNLYLMRNSLVAINTVASLEKLGNNVLDSTLQAFLKPETNATGEVGDSGNYEIDLDRVLTEASKQIAFESTSNKPQSPPQSTTAATTTTTTTQKPTTTTSIATTSEKVLPSSSSTIRPTRPPNRRANNRQGQRRNTTRRVSSSSSSTTTSTTTTTTTLKPIVLY